MHFTPLITTILTASVSTASALKIGIDTKSSPNPASPVNTLAGFSYKDCGSPTDPFQLSSLALSPDPPVTGSDLTLTLSFTAQETIEEGAYAYVTVKLGLVKILQKQFDICEELRNRDIEPKCPIAPGDYTIVRTQNLPKDIPRAVFNVNVQAYTAEDDDLGCLSARVDLMKPFPIVGKEGL